jgi:hypothetical protein
VLVLISYGLLALANTSTEDAEGEVPVWARALAVTDRSILDPGILGDAVPLDTTTAREGVGPEPELRDGI